MHASVCSVVKESEVNNTGYAKTLNNRISYLRCTTKISTAVWAVNFRGARDSSREAEFVVDQVVEEGH